LTKGDVSMTEATDNENAANTDGDARVRGSRAQNAQTTRLDAPTGGWTEEERGEQ